MLVGSVLEDVMLKSMRLEYVSSRDMLFANGSGEQSRAKASMFVAFFIGQAFGQAQLFQPHIPGSLYRGSAASQGVAYPIIPQSMPVQMVLFSS